LGLKALDARILLHRRSRQLSGRSRVGRFARASAWTLVISFIRRCWPVLLGATVLPVAVTLPCFFFLEKGTSRWVLLGAALASGPWLAVLIVIVLSGVADVVMGLEAEGDTATSLRQLQRRGWRLVNGVQVRGDEDIDHIALGSAGVVIVESKWSRHSWPLNASNKSFMADRLADAIGQVRRNARAVRLGFAGVLEGVPVYIVCVLWSSEKPADERGWMEHDDVVVVHGPEFSAWMRTLTPNVVDEKKMEEVWTALNRQVEVRDRNDRKRSIRHRPTLFQLAIDFLIVPFLSAAVALYSFVVLVKLGWWWVDVLAFVGYPLAGLSIWRRLAWRPAAMGWLTVVAVFEIELAVALVRALFR
jgi:hypothetical protein